MSAANLRKMLEYLGSVPEKHKQNIINIMETSRDNWTKEFKAVFMEHKLRG
jgi:hypothetical protein